jgi:hypothetical protein
LASLAARFLTSGLPAPARASRASSPACIER